MVASVQFLEGLDFSWVYKVAATVLYILGLYLLGIKKVLKA